MPKCASSSLEEVLESYLLGIPTEVFGERNRRERITETGFVSGEVLAPKKHFMRPHVNCNGIRRLVGEARFGQYLKATSVRNPWDQIVSSFWWRLRNHSYARELAIKSPMWLLRVWFSVWYLMNRKNLTKLSFTSQLKVDGELMPMHIIRHESIEADFTELLQKLGFSAKDLDLPSRKGHHRSRPEPYQLYYFGFLRDSVARDRSDDLSNFGYQWVKESAS